ncbi:MAG: HAD hydrolase family protein [Treponema sp.]|jgi:hydroxymethylpyrimidine pyrophosphatase-like HAD family hydrolase|nr:HAD hydrolase family protein [Treponema sp.]
MPDLNIFASDLDNTLIHSYKTAKPGDVCVEMRNGKELSFMSKKAYSLLKKTSEKCLIIPVTTRSLEQYRRLDLGISFKYAVVAHGALFLEDGKNDERWKADTHNLFNTPLPKIEESENLFDIRVVEDVFIFAKSKEPDSAASLLEKTIDTSEFSVYAVYNKVYIFPKNFDKGTAVKRLERKLNAKVKICAGDSDLDTPMLNIADIALTPRISETDDLAYFVLSFVFNAFS